MTQLILASQSVYRKQLLKRLGVTFTCQASHINEAQQPNEPADQLCKRLAREKALAVISEIKDSIIIGSDQVCACENEILGKPGNKVSAAEQLRLCSGNTVTFYTGLFVFDQSTNTEYEALDVTKVVFRDLTSQEISNYLEADQPYDCAGSFKVESLGVALFEKVCSEDPTALIGLPLIRLCEILRTCKADPLASKR
ncbi:Maf family protein [Marinicella sp. W31]|uniref:Maf family protein n=1 Tax=Marinicella sp. W31 TaxID=3023713 RepID=UPI00375773FF